MSAKFEYKFFSDSLPVPRELNYITCFTENALNELGSQGWELVSVTPQSNVTNSNLSGFTTVQLWVFKREINN